MIRSSCVLLLVLLACSARAQDGAAVYARRCASCHDNGAASRAPARDAIAALTPDRIVAALESGTMRVQGEALSGDERRAVANYLSTARGAAPTAPADAPRCVTAPQPANGPRDWAAWGVTLANDRFQRAPGLTADQVASLRLKWAFGFDGEIAAAANPTIVGDRVYVGSGQGRVFAIGLGDGCLAWTFKADGGVRAAVSVGPAKPGAAGASAFVADLRATVYSLDAATGALQWKRKLDDHRAARISGSPVLYSGRLYVPLSSGEEGVGALAAYECCTFRGSVVALDAATGDEVWRTYLIKEIAVAQGKNARGTTIWGPSGAAVWSAPTIDPETRSLYVGTGDSYTEPAAPTSDAIVALDLGTGAVKWVTQVTAGDAFNMACGSTDTTNCPQRGGPDHDFGQSPILLTLGTGRRVLVAGQKSGVVHAFDPDENGRRLWDRPVGRGGELGGIEWGSASDGQNMYVPLSDITFKEPTLRGRGGLDSKAGGGLFAVRVADGSVAWTARPNGCGDRPSCSPALSAPSSVIPGAVFAGSIDGHFRAYATGDGHVLWDFDAAREFTTVNGVTARGGSFDVGGPAIAGGVVVTTSGYGTWGGMRGNVLLAFSVDGK
ncbi:MAG: PQQ-binding-like beta-propeller repeat protein [Vicinamibacterales bacterium]